MLILLTAWFIHNWWKLLLGVAAIVVILEYHYYYKKPVKEKTVEETEAESIMTMDQKEDAQHENSDGK